MENTKAGTAATLAEDAPRYRVSKATAALIDAYKELMHLHNFSLYQAYETAWGEDAAQGFIYGECEEAFTAYQEKILSAITDNVREHLSMGSNGEI